MALMAVSIVTSPGIANLLIAVMGLTT